MMGVGWNQPIRSEMLAGIVPHVRLQLIDEHGFVVAAARDVMRSPVGRMDEQWHTTNPI